jgi:hypothetical protein
MKPKADLKTGREGPCVYCGEHCIEVQDPHSFVIDVGAEDAEHPGDPEWCDWGCGENPQSGADGVAGHLLAGGAE